MAKVVIDEEKVKDVFGRYVEEVFPSKEKALEIFRSGRRLTFYLGIDPTGPDIHLGHTIPLLLLKKIGELGHKVILLIGDFTARIGDPTGKEAVRTALTEKEVKDNMKTYVEQARKILGDVSFEVKYNSKWLKKMTLEDIVRLTSMVTVQQMEKRDMFRRRRLEQKWKCPQCGKISPSPIQFNEGVPPLMENNRIICQHCGDSVLFEVKDIFSEPIYVHEFLYPLMQGYDSVAMEVDGEVGGNDQTFNMLVGRDLEKEYLSKEKLVFATKLLVDAVTGKKISKTEGGFISVNDTPKNVFGKTMKSVPDEMIKTVFELCTEKSQTWIDARQKEIDKGGNPKDFKEELAFELTRMYYGEKEAIKAKEEFERIFFEKKLPSEIREFKISGGSMDLGLVLKDWLEISHSEAKRLIGENAVKVNGKTVNDWNCEVKKGDIVKMGSKNFARIS